MRFVLIAHPNASEAVRIMRSLSTAYHVAIATNLPEFDNQVADIDFLLIDEEFEGSGFLDVVQRAAQDRHLPVLILAGPEAGRLVFRGMRCGARNYVVKAGDYLDILPLSIEETLAAYKAVEEIRKSNEQLQSRVKELESRLRTAGVVSGGAKASDSRGDGGLIADYGVFGDLLASVRSGEITLPTLPAVRSKFRELVSRNAAFDETAALLRKDMAISSKLIAVSNSGRFRGAVANHTLEQALARLGLHVTQQFVEVICNRGLYTTKNPRYVRLVEQLWKHSLCVANAAQAIHQLGSVELVEDPFTLGLLHDIGSLVLLQIVGELEMKGRFGEKLDEVKVLRTLDAYHGVFGGSILKRWGFNDTVIHVALYHDSPDQVDKRSNDLLVIHAANAISYKAGYPPATATEQTGDLSSLLSVRELALTPGVLDRVTKSTVAEMDEFKEHVF